MPGNDFPLLPLPAAVPLQPHVMGRMDARRISRSVRSDHWQRQRKIRYSPFLAFHSITLHEGLGKE